MKISVVGTGYVGLVSGVCLAELGHTVVCLDNDAEKIKAIAAGQSPIYEEGLDALLERNLGGRLSASTDLEKGVLESELTLIAVGTPFDGSEIDLRYVKQVSREIGAVLKKKNDYHVVVVKSTVVPGTTDEVVLPLLEESSGKKAGRHFGVGMNPEFLREGAAIADFMNPDRIVLGGIDDATIEKLAEVYAPFKSTDLVKTNTRTAEMIKYASNSLLATLISFSNEIGNMCSSVGGIDALEVMNGVHLDKRLSPILEDGRRITPAVTTYLEAGCGFGGSCFPKDVKALISHGISVGEPMRLLRAVMEINEHQPAKMLDLLRKHFPDLSGRKIAVLGLAFKPGTDDMRESPAIPIVQSLCDAKAVVKAFDPIAQERAEALFADYGVEYGDSIEGTVGDVDAVLVLTRWPQFTDLPAILKRLGRSPVVVDGRRLLPKDSVGVYEGIGY